MADMLSQDEIDALLGGGSSSSVDEFEPAVAELLTDVEKDAIGEIGNINMGTASTTLFTLLNQKVTITTPNVSETSLKNLAAEFESPCVVIIIRYKVGITGLNLLILKVDDVKIITDLMMGGDGLNVPEELTDLHLSAINEAMNQMIGSSSTSLSDMLKTKIDISPPESIYSDISNLDFDNLGIGSDVQLVKVSFRMTVGDLIDSEIMQLIPVDIAKQMIKSIMPDEKEEVPDLVIAAPEPGPANRVESPIPSADNYNPHQANIQPGMGQQQQQAQYQQGQPGGFYQPHQNQAPNINAMPFQFDNFDAQPGQYIPYNTEIELIKDVPLEITVELGRTKKRISDILDFGIGTVVELDKLVGESLDILANGKKIAKGEVVVVDENYGIRITEINTHEKRV